MAKFYRCEHDGGAYCFFHCPGCGYAHSIRVEHPKGWQWNGSIENPTVSPSILAKGEKRCHSFVKNGQIQFLNDCTHELAGQTVEIPEWEV